MSDDRHLLTDIRIRVHHRELRPVYHIATRQRRIPQRKAGSRTVNDLDTVSGRDNLGQAVIIRLLTPRGELAGLGHPDYGSRLHELVGRVNTETTRNLVKLHILESLKREPRIETVPEIQVTPHPVQRTRVEVQLTVQPVGLTDTVTIGPFSLRLAP